MRTKTVEKWSLVLIDAGLLMLSLGLFYGVRRGRCGGWYGAFAREVAFARNP